VLEAGGDQRLLQEADSPMWLRAISSDGNVAAELDVRAHATRGPGRRDVLAEDAISACDREPALR